MIPPPEADDACGGGAADRGSEPATARGRGRPAAQDLEELTPALVQFLLAHPELKAVAKVTQVCLIILSSLSLAHSFGLCEKRLSYCASAWIRSFLAHR